MAGRPAMADPRSKPALSNVWTNKLAISLSVNPKWNPCLMPRCWNCVHGQGDWIQGQKIYNPQHFKVIYCVRLILFSSWLNSSLMKRCRTRWGGGVICFILSCICALRGQSFGCCMMGVCKWRAFILLGHNTSKSQSATHGGSGARAAAWLD